jgi:redox-sensitive bicupin YhaK (pirin superfamily)
MTQTTFVPPAPQRSPARGNRRVVARTNGRTHGPVTRLVSPSDIGELIKPFVFVDHFDMVPKQGSLFPMHPHSGIATVTVLLSGDLRYEDTTGAAGTLSGGSIEWMRAGSGVWHDASPSSGAPFRGYQVWVALPPELENGPAYSQYLPPAAVPAIGPARLVLGRHAGVRSPVDSPAGIDLLHVRLGSGQHWRYTPPAGQDVAWVHVDRGVLRVADERLKNELAVFDSNDGILEFEAEGEVEFVLGSAVKHPHSLVLGYYSVHTSVEALRRGEAEIARIGSRLRHEGRLPPVSDANLARSVS